ncbi:DUF305 domain-containing protein [Streptomyces sp. NPDC005876]|uniref:DUF305 domain-containing protein n=1 Tax=Streptomyces sp. NPDC005876 TaxID=3157076 RepID=UPI0033F42E78
MTYKRSLPRRSAAVLAAGAAVLVLANCGGGGGDGDGPVGHGGHRTTASPSASPGRPNAADVAFASGMIPHHRQAVEMAGLAPGRARSAEVRRLAAEIEKAQAPEIRTLSGWLTSWGEEVPAEGAMDHSAHGMGGMMTDEEMSGLAHASGTAFDTAFLTMMIEHHRGAVAMARTERADGAYAPATGLAEEIITSQSAEIERMNRLLGED